MNLTVGTALQGGKYVLTQAVGGSRSLTFKATQTQRNRSMVLKTLNLQAVENPTSLKRQWMEKVRALSQCHHPALATVVDWFEEDGLPFAVMDCVPGQSLGDRTTGRGPLAEPESVQYVRQVGSALSLLHRQGLVHQDVKPGNLIQPIGANLVVLVDFGFAELAGTPGFAGQEYAAIEQFQSKPLTSATDIYALAASLYFLLTGQAPIAAPLRHHSPLIPLQQLRPQVSPTLEAAILAGLELNPASRPQTIAAWFSLLEGNSSPMANRMNPTLADKQVAIELPALTVAPPKGSSPPVASVTPAVLPDSQVLNGELPRGQTPNSQTPSRTVVRSVPPRRRVSRAFVVGAALAGSIGVGLGLVLRISGGTGPGSSFFHTEQAFPKLKDSTNAATSTSVQEKFSPAADPPATKAYTPAPVVAAPSRRAPVVDRTAPALDPIPTAPSSLPRATVSEPTPVVSPVSPVNPAPSPPAQLNEPAPPSIPEPPTPIPTPIPLPPAIRQPRV